MKYINLSKKHYTQYKNLIDSNITEEYFTYFIENVLNKNHKIIVIEDSNNNLIGTGTILIEKKLTNGSY